MGRGGGKIPGEGQTGRQTVTAPPDVINESENAVKFNVGDVSQPAQPSLPSQPAIQPSTQTQTFKQAKTVAPVVELSPRQNKSCQSKLLRNETNMEKSSMMC